MDDRDLHVHVCECGEQWRCSKADCHIADECSQCTDDALTEWAESNGFDLIQFALLEDN